MLKLISVNIETDMHHEKLVPFFKNENPDVVCLQEIFEKDLIVYEEALGMKSFFKPMSVHTSIKDKQNSHPAGVAILLKDEAHFNFAYYEGDEINIPTFGRSKDLRVEPHIENQVVIWANILKQGQSYTIATTHLAATFEGASPVYQIQRAEKLLTILESFDTLILCGDLNAPRGGKTFSLFNEKYIDNIPLSYDSSLDPKLFRNPSVRLMVDGLFSTPEYMMSNVKLVEGLSDHKAIVGYIERA